MNDYKMGGIIMAMFDEITSKLTKTAKKAVRKSNELVEITKMNMAISEAQSALNKLYKELGKTVHKACETQDNVSNEISEKCSEIDDELEHIKKMKDKLAELKKVQYCMSCGHENQREAIFCSKCGMKIE